MAQEIGELQFVGKIAQKALIVRDGAILAVRNVGDERWNLPGGRLHVGEAPKDGLAREVLEELGVSIKIENPVWTDTFISDSIGPHFSVFYKASLANDNAFTLASDEIEEVRWLTLSDLDLLWNDCKDAARLVLSV